MINNGKGGANTKTGLIFEGKTDLATGIIVNSQGGGGGAVVVVVVVGGMVVVVVKEYPHQSPITQEGHGLLNGPLPKSALNKAASVPSTSWSQSKSP